MIIVEPSVELLWITPDPEKQIEIAGRTCYKSEDKITEDSARKFVATLYKSGHHAMLEHCVASFKVITDRGVSHEIVRHRIASYAQESTRYVNYSKEKFGSQISVIRPPFANDPAPLTIWAKACRNAEKSYFAMLEAGCKPQIARSVLPTCTKTEIVITMNLREWIHFFTLRISKAAHPQIIPISAWIKYDLGKHVDIVNHIPLNID